MAGKIMIESAEPFRVCNSCYKGDRVYNILIRYAYTNSGTQISLCRECLKKLNDEIGETLWKEDSARMAETHEKREETRACDLVDRQAAINELNEQIKLCDKALSSFDISMRDAFAIKVERASLVAFGKTLKDMPSAQPEINHCAECIHWKHSAVRKSYCEVFDWMSKAEDFCSFAERRTNE